MCRAQKTCLIADDDPVYRDVAAAALESAGYTVTVANDGGEAMQALAAQPFDIVVADLTMPVADGIQVIAAMRERGPNVFTPIVVITGLVDAEAVERAFETGATSFLTKPLNWPLFTHHIDFVYRNGQTEKDLREAHHASAFLSDLKSQTMRSLAQDFMRPVKTIFGFSELIRREVYGPLLPAAYNDMIADMGAAAQTLNASLLKLMNLGASLGDRLDLNEDWIPITDFIETATAGFQNRALRRGVSLQVSCAFPDDLAVKADLTLLSQALRSVVDNAIKMAPRGSVIELNAEFGTKGEFCFSATDFGPAISAELVAEIARPGADLTAPLELNPTRDVGIKIAKALAELHQGRLNVRLDKTGGNVVELALPASRFESAARLRTATRLGRGAALTPAHTASLAAQIGEVLHQRSAD